MNEFVETVKDSVGYEILWILLGLLLGELIKYGINWSDKKLKKRKLHKALKNHNNIVLEGKDIISLDHADPTYEMHDIFVRESGKKLFIDCPEEYKEIIRLHDPDFVFSQNTSFNRSSDFNDLAEITGIANLPGLIDKHSRVAVGHFIAKLENGHTIFNGKKYRVFNIRRKRVADGEENASLKLDLFETDYFTHHVFRSIYKELKAEGHPISKIEKMEEIHRYSPFLTSFGINAFILLENHAESEIVFAKRSKYLNTGTEESLWHVSMNEGLTETDREGKEVSLIKCLHRGLREELGIREEHHKYIIDERFMDLFLETNRFEIGLTSFVRLDMRRNQLNSLYDISKDGELETDGIVSIPFKQKELSRFVKGHSLTNAAKYTLKMLLARRKFML
ncbi:hypothetical protein [Planococcus maitriensis]|uniref:Nudix hydrolase domain-containing protein n=1 Tax=Planococcus maitriensis TaxID=221799 RepID=A0A365KA22_9BACL|nr:hypothetical protein [Planococcus maitriensis]RAZ69643.1 hypothetical protein DP119_03015 [Planococcus maitriensis]